MRLLAVILGILLLVPTVSAVGIMVPPELSDDEVETFSVNNSEEITFSVKGDDENHTLDFYVESDFDGITMNGEPRFSSRFDISQYEKVDISVNFIGKEESNGSFTIEYGFKYVTNESNSSSIGFEQVTSSDFRAEVVCSICDNDDDEDGVDEESGGEGTGGTGDVNLTQDTSQDNQDNQNNQADAQIQDVTNSNTALNEESVDNQNNQNSQRDLPDSVGRTTSTTDGSSAKFWNGLLLTLMVGLFVLEGAAYKVADEVYEG